MNLRLYVGNTIESLWESAMLPWFSCEGRAAWREVKPTVVLCPDHTLANSVKATLSARQVPYLNVLFWTPDDLRAHLTKLLGITSVVTDVALLKAILSRAAGAVEELRPSDPIAAATRRSPDPLWDTIEILEGGGWGMEMVPGEVLRLIAAEFQGRLRAAGIRTPRSTDFAISKSANGLPPQFAALFLLGFGAQHWPLWPLLTAAVRLSRSSVGCLRSPRVKGEEADIVWQNSWEELAERVDYVEEASASPLSVFSERFDEHGAVHPPPETDSERLVTVNVADNQIMEAKIAAIRAAALLSRGITPVAIAVPSAGILSREISLHLDRLGIDHYNTVPPTQSLLAAVPAWMPLFLVQSEPTVDRLVAFLRTLDRLPAELSTLEPRRLAALIERAGQTAVFSEIQIMARLFGIKQPDDEVAQRFLSAWPIWPLRSTMANYLSLARALATQLGWGEVATVIEDWEKRKKDVGGVELERSVFCQWFALAAQECRAIRSDRSRHPYSRVLILRPAEATGRRWGHVIFTGQNEGIWPPPVRPGGYLSDEDRERLNNEIKRLNCGALKAGRFGEGHTIVRDGHAFIVGPYHARSLVFRDFIQTLDASDAVTLLASASDVVSAGACLHPGEFLSRSHQLLTGEEMSRELFERMALDAAAAVPAGVLAPTAQRVDVAPMLAAIKARESSEITEYDFSLNAHPDWDIYIPPSKWATFYDRPAEVFLNSVLGVTAPQETQSEIPWALVSGTWIHDWLSTFAGLRAKGSPGAPDRWDIGVAAAACAHRQKVESVLAEMGRTLPCWWESLWGQALAEAKLFGGSLNDQSSYAYLASERVLPRRAVALPSGRKLIVGGRLDLVFSDAPIAAWNETAAIGNMFIVDFKSGKDRALSSKGLAKGDGLQLGLYGLGLHALGAGAVSMAIAKAGDPIVPQISLTDLTDNMAVFEQLAENIDIGRFGWSGPIRNPYAACVTYPIATLAVSMSTTAKFNRTHGL